MNDSSCGTCTLCCKLVPFEATLGELPFGRNDSTKKAGEWCGLCRRDGGCNGGSGGCTAFGNEQRPNACSTFECFWLKSQETEHPLPLALRPDQIGAVTVIGRTGLDVVVNPALIKSKPWRKPGLLRQMIAAWDAGGIAVTLRCGHYQAAVSKASIHRLNLGGRKPPPA